MLEDCLTANIEGFLENKKYKFKIYAVENYEGSKKEGNLLSLSVYFYPPIKEFDEKIKEFHQIFEDYFTKLKIPCKKILVRKEKFLQEYSLDKAIIALGSSIVEGSYYLQFACYSSKGKIQQDEILKIKELFEKFRMFLEYNGCKSKRLDYFVNHLCRRWLLKYRKGLSPSVWLESYLKADPINKIKLNQNFVDDLMEEYVKSEQIFEDKRPQIKNQKNLFTIIEEIEGITKPISLLLSKRIVLPKNCGEKFMDECEGILDKYDSIRKEILDKINQDPEQKKLESYEEEYLETLVKLKNAEGKKEIKNLIKEARRFAAEFNYNPEKDLEKYLEPK